MEEKNRLRSGRRHTVEIEERESTQVTGVLDVEAFNEEEIMLVTEKGMMVLAGKGLHIVRLDLEEGVLAAEGTIEAMEYIQDEKGGKKGLLSGLFH